MGSLTNTILLAVAFITVFFQAKFEGLRNLVGAQFDLLPGLMVYASLSHGLPTLTLLSILGGLWFDSMSANPLGISILPLFLVGVAIQRYRGLILRDQTFAQLLLGLAASAACPVLTLLLLLNMDRQPLMGWGSLWQWAILSVVGGIMTPFWFRFFDRVSQAVNYRATGETSFRADREIKRGRF